MIKLSAVSKDYGEVKALAGINLKLPEHGVVGLLGPNGAGKTTLIKILAETLEPTGGEVERLVERGDIGFLPENNPLYDWLTVGEYLTMVAEIKHGGGNIGETVRNCGLIEVVEKKIGQLSKGYRQRTGLAASLIGNPKILLLDEPTSGLDPKQIVEIRKLIVKLAKNRLVVLSTHILSEAKEICQRLVIINRGKIVLDEETSRVSNLEKKFIKLTE